MYISKLELHGFKSFGTKTVMKFGEGITGVVGPNGCGKTNIVDALRWVLGEQKQSVLRSTTMDEIIFNGSKNHKSSGMAEVNLTIHNNKSKLPIEYTDIEITRRLYRDGESEYLINRTPCRLKDILDLFIDTGMGTDAYSVIELKMIEEILSDLGDERRRMFEEAAGINRYKKQRASTAKKLEATRIDLERVGDIILEVDSKVKALALQLKRFERHKAITTQLKDQEMILARRKINALSHEIEPLQSNLTEIKITFTSEKTVISKNEEQIAKLKADHVIHEENLRDSRESLSTSNSKLGEVKDQQLIWREQLRSHENSLDRFGREEQSELERRGDYHRDIDRLNKELQEVAPKLADMQKALEVIRDQEDTITKSFKNGEHQRQVVRDKRYQHLHEVQEVAARLNRTEEILNEKRTTIERYENMRASIDENLKTISKKRNMLKKDKAGLEKALTGLAKKITAVQAETEAATIREQELGAQYQEVHTQTQVLKSRLDLLRELMESGEGYPTGTRDLLAKRKELPGVIGTVADMVSAPGEYGLVMDSVLGNLAACVIIETAEAANEIMKYAHEHKFGKLAVIPLDQVQDVAKRGAKPVAGSKALIDIIDAEKRLLPLYRQLFAGYYIADNDSSAKLTGNHEITYLTKAGDQFGEINVLLHGGGASKQGATSTIVIGRAQEMKSLQTSINVSGGDGGKLEKQLAENQEKRNVLAENIKELRQNREEFESRLHTLTGEESQLEYEANRMLKDLAELDESLPAIQNTIAEHEKSRVVLKEKLEGSKSKEEKLDQEISQAEENYHTVKSNMDQWQANLQERRVGLLNVENQRENLANRRLSLEDSLKATNDRLAQLNADRETALQSIKDLNQMLSDALARNHDLEGQVKIHQEATSNKETEVKLILENISSLETTIRQQQHGREVVFGQQQELELAIMDLTNSEKMIRAHIRQQYGLEVDPIAGEYDEELSLPDLDELIARHKNSLVRIGPINMAVAEEYSEEHKRFTFLSNQRDDLIQAEISLRETIETVDGQARELFRTTYDQIRFHFKNTFNMFFEGGEGDLRLTGDPDPLESNIEIFAKPPGKKTRSLRSLSAGEKALTAIALLFAIYMVKPSPFCILDEVDAPLDDGNIAKFSQVINEFAKDTQFIIVTHNKLTMEKANYLFGVTMEEPGLSKMVSVDIGAYAN